MKAHISFLLTCLILSTCALAAADEPRSRGAYVEEISNEHSSFAVRVDVNREDRVYGRNDLLTATVESSADGYLYLFYTDAEGSTSVLFPNRFQANNAIRAKESVTVPAPGSSFQIRIDAPYGEETLKAVVSRKPLDSVDFDRMTKANMTPMDARMKKQFSDGLAAKSIKSADWAEHQVRIQTMAVRPGAAASESGKRFAVGIGISDYSDSNVPNLGVCHVDAEKMMALFTQKCGVAANDAILLCNEKATLGNIRKILKDTLPEVTKPGDTVFIFWSGHGGQTSDKSREFLVPHDGSNSDLENTMLFDETFGRWMQDLDGRKILIVLDACHSGGQATAAKSGTGVKSLSKALDGTAADGWRPLRFAFTQMAVAKDIGQRDAAVIASSTAEEVSFVRKERDLSVLTYYLLKVIDDARGPISHTDWCQAVRSQVNDYVDNNFTEHKQTVVMQDDMTEPLILNP